MAKRGKFGGEKEVWRCDKCLLEQVLPIRASAQVCPKCGNRTHRLLSKLLEKGSPVGEPPTAGKIRDHVINQLGKLASN